MRRSCFKEAKISLWILSFVLFISIMFYLVATMFTSMGYRGKSKEALTLDESKDEIVIVLDAGHGGEDPGATDNGLVEKDLNLDVTLRINSMLLNSGYKTVLTRREDVLLYRAGEESKKKYYDLRNRAEIAEAYPNAVFVSIHMNKFPIDYCKGLQTFYTKNNSESEILAEAIQESVRLLQTENKREIKDSEDTIYLLSYLKSPSVLVECGFISNAEEAQKLSDEKYRDLLAFNIYCGIAKYLEEHQHEN